MLLVQVSLALYTCVKCESKQCESALSAYIINDPQFSFPMAHLHANNNSFQHHVRSCPILPPQRRTLGGVLDTRNTTRTVNSVFKT